MTNGIEDFPPLPGEVVQAWIAAGANYGIMQNDPTAYSIRSRVEPVAGEQRGLPGFSFRKWKLRDGITLKLLESLPIPPTPFGLSISSHHGCPAQMGKLKSLARFRDTLIELELWGDSRVQKELSELQTFHKLRSLGLCSMELWGHTVVPYLQSLPELESLRVDESEFTIDEARTLSQLSRLKQLSLAVYGPATPEALDCLASLPQLESISLFLNKPIPELSECLSRLKSLRHFEINNSQLPDGVFRSLGKLPHLEELKLINANLMDEDLQDLCQSPSLANLNISGTAVTDDGLALLTNLPSLKSLDVSRTKAGVHALNAISTLTGLEELNLAETSTSNDELACIGKLGQLKSLILCATMVEDSGLPHLANLTQLEYLNLGVTKVTDDGLAQLLPLKSLRKLDLRQTKVTDDGLVRLQGLPALEEIDLDVRVMTDRGLQNYLTVVRKPRKLSLQNTAVTDAGLRYLSDCPDLEILNLATTKVSHLPKFNQLTNLTHLNLCHTCLSVKGFEQLAQMQNLLTLDLSNLQVKHPLTSLLKLKSLTSLGTLQIYSWSLQTDEIDELRQALPNCKIQS